jgi:hypothetical protein
MSKTFTKKLRVFFFPLSFSPFDLFHRVFGRFCA